MAPTTTTTTTLAPLPVDQSGDGAGTAANGPDAGGGRTGIVGVWYDLPGWSLPFVGALGMLAVIALATGAVRLAPVAGRGIGAVALSVSRGWETVLGRRRRTKRYVDPGFKRPGPFRRVARAPLRILGAIGAFFADIGSGVASLFRRPGKQPAPGSTVRHENRMRPLSTIGGWFDRPRLKVRQLLNRSGELRADWAENRHYLWVRWRAKLWGRKP